MAEIALGARICTKGADAGLGYVEIDLHDPVLAPEQFDQHREPRLQAFAHPGPALPQKGVLGGLLADSGAAPKLAPLPVALDGLADRLQIKDTMAAEARILGGDRSARHRSEERRVGNKGGSTGRSRVRPAQSKKKK